MSCYFHCHIFCIINILVSTVPTFPDVPGFSDVPDFLMVEVPESSLKMKVIECEQNVQQHSN